MITSRTTRFWGLIAIGLLLFNCQNQPAAGEKQAVETDQTTTAVAQPDTTKKSIPRETTADLGGVSFTIAYHSPGVRNRVIWGGLVPMGEVWVTGAHMATAMTVSADFYINNQRLPAGKYALFTIPGEEEWTVIVNKNWEQHLTDEYSAADDVMRFTVKPMETQHTERLTYSITPTSEKKANLAISWEKVQITFPIRVD